MNSVNVFVYFFRKSPLVRALLWLLFILLFIGISFLIGIKINKKPVIFELNPAVGAPGDVVVITGKDFGTERENGYAEFGGRKLTASSYVSWKDDEIKIILPANIQDGLVFVVTKNSRSKPVFFANEKEAPSTVPADINSSLPVISSFSPLRCSVGSLLVLNGINFGSTRGKSKVYFSINRSNNSPKRNNEINIGKEEENFISGNENDFDYEYWSNSEIRIRIPDGAVSGAFFIETDEGRSIVSNLNINRQAGTKLFLSPKSYLIQVSSDLEDNSADKDSFIILRCPIPYTTASQPYVKLIECSPEPAIAEYQHAIIHQVQGEKNSNQKKRFSQNFAVTVYETITNINADKIAGREAVNKILYISATKPDACIPSDHPDIIALADKIRQSEKNIYTTASLIYNYMIDNYKILNTLNSAAVHPLTLLSNKKGDAYDFAIIFTSLLRASGIAALPVSGILISSDLKTQNHWWCEFYLPGFGWVPADPALGAGLEYQSWQKALDARKYYFGNLDAQHILFSKGWADIKPSSLQNKIVGRVKSYALQSIWEEASKKTTQYSSYWQDPVVIGVY